MLLKAFYMLQDASFILLKASFMTFTVQAIVATIVNYDHNLLIRPLIAILLYAVLLNVIQLVGILLKCAQLTNVLMITVMLIVLLLNGVLLNVIVLIGISSNVVLLNVANTMITNSEMNYPNKLFMTLVG